MAGRGVVWDGALRRPGFPAWLGMHGQVWRGEFYNPTPLKPACPQVKFILDNWLLILLAAASGGMLLWQTLQKSQAGAIGTAEAVRLINRERAVLIDVGEPAEFAAAHVKGARNVPLGSVEGSRDLPSNKALPLLLLCPSGARARRAAGLLRKAGFAQALAVAGGTGAWREAGLPIEKSA
jgi:rhodanese-related sulfurtransferase